jgi:hypothetical protein
MVKIQLDLTEKANKKLERYRVYNGVDNKAKAINNILEFLNLNEDKQDWLDREDVL